MGCDRECFVTAAWRRHGIGSALVAHALAWCKAQGIRHIEPGVLANNTEAAAFWTQCGFQPYRVLMYTQIT
jgi:GNAT superfamily N-acetyltransferase